MSLKLYTLCAYNMEFMSLATSSEALKWKKPFKCYVQGIFEKKQLYIVLTFCTAEVVHIMYVV